MDYENAIEVKGLTRRYGKLTAVDNFSFDVARGEIFGLIGPDGAGKTTLFRLLTTLINSSDGSASVCGLDIVSDYKKIREHVGYMPGKFSLYQDLSVEENLDFFAALFNVTVEQNYDLIMPIYQQLEPFRSRRAGNLSGGMKQKLALCCALIHRPEVLFLDEPTTGVDALSRGEFWEMLAGLKEKGISILVSTPYMDEAGKCDRIALCNAGKILKISTPEGIISDFSRPLYSVRGSDMYRILVESRTVDGVEKCYPFGSVHHIIASDEFEPARLNAALTRCGVENVEVEKIEAKIEDVFIDLMEKNE